jgi:hypothetical protein
MDMVLHSSAGDVIADTAHSNILPTSAVVHPMVYMRLRYLAMAVWRLPCGGIKIKTFLEGLS